jgi:putative transposase
MYGPKLLPLDLSDPERQGLEHLIRRHTPRQQIALRARLILAAADGQSNTAIAHQFQVSLDCVRLWRKRWRDLQPISLADLSGEARLEDLPRPGAPPRIRADQRSQIVALACAPPSASGRPITHWTGREIAAELVQRGIVAHISPRHAARLFKSRGSPAAAHPLLADRHPR